MLLFNLVLLLHFTAFLWYSATLVLLYPKQERRTHKAGLALGITILVTGLLLVALKYPAINYYKVVPKLIIFVVISILNSVYSKKPLPGNIYAALVSLTLLASLIAVVKL